MSEDDAYFEYVKEQQQRKESERKLKEEKSKPRLRILTPINAKKKEPERELKEEKSKPRLRIITPISTRRASNAEIITAWQLSNSAQECAENLNMNRARLIERVSDLREKGWVLERLPEST